MKPPFDEHTTRLEIAESIVGWSSVLLMVVATACLVVGGEQMNDGASVFIGLGAVLVVGREMISRSIVESRRRHADLLERIERDLKERTP